jgi:hypothetical protein
MRSSRPLDSFAEPGSAKVASRERRREGAAGLTVAFILGLAASLQALRHLRRIGAV